MAIICYPQGVEHGDIVSCALCDQDLSLHDATAGFYFYDGRQAFACNEHFYSTSELVAGWTDFIVDQRKATLQHLEVSGYESSLY